jgi:hypothetical protein
MLRRDNGLVRWHPAGAPVVAGGCCCETVEPDAPSSCPCDPWPLEDSENPGFADPEGFPCGGLLYQYSIDSYSYVEKQWDDDTCAGLLYSYYEFELTSATTLTATTATCTWSGIGSGRYRTAADGAWTNVADALIILILGAGRWGVGVDNYGGFVVPTTGYKTTGLTPVGAYSHSENCNPLTITEWWTALISAAVS